MTDLTPEQIERWAGDEASKMSFRDHVGGAIEALSDPAVVDLPWDAPILHAHALHLQQQATIERLTALIDEHNRDLENSCGVANPDYCKGFTGRGRRCPTCPKDYMIDTQDGVKA